MKTRFRILSFNFVFILFIPLAAFAWSGKCVGVSDGDTISVMHEGKAERIRLYGIDCPEWRQPFYKWAKKFSSDLACGKMVQVKTI